MLLAQYIRFLSWETWFYIILVEFIQWVQLNRVSEYFGVYLNLSKFRINLSKFRINLSKFRINLSKFRINLSKLFINLSNICNFILVISHKFIDISHNLSNILQLYFSNFTFYRNLFELELKNLQRFCFISSENPKND